MQVNSNFVFAATILYVYKCAEERRIIARLQRSAYDRAIVCPREPWDINTYPLIWLQRSQHDEQEAEIQPAVISSFEQYATRISEPS